MTELPITACMGGFCHRRDRCEHYAATSRRVVVERLCEPGRSDAFAPRYDPRFAAWIAAMPEPEAPT